MNLNMAIEDNFPLYKSFLGINAKFYSENPPEIEEENDPYYDDGSVDLVILFQSQSNTQLTNSKLVNNQTNLIHDISVISDDVVIDDVQIERSFFKVFNKIYIIKSYAPITDKIYNFQCAMIKQKYIKKENI